MYPACLQTMWVITVCFETSCPGAAVIVVASYSVVTDLSPSGRREKFVYFASLPYRIFLLLSICNGDQQYNEPHGAQFLET